MRLHPWNEVLAAVDDLIRNKGAQVYQQFNCEHCGAKQTIDTPNSFHRTGICEECKQTTNIEKNGMNYMVSFNLGSSHE